MIIFSRQKQSLNDYTININIDGVQVNQTTLCKSLWLNVDENLSWKAHIHEISKKCPWVFVRLSESGHLFPWTLQVKYTKVLLNYTLITAVLSERAFRNSWLINSKNYKIALLELSLNQAMTLVLDNFLTCSAATTYGLEGLDKRLT